MQTNLGRDAACFSYRDQGKQQRSKTHKRLPISRLSIASLPGKQAGWESMNSFSARIYCACPDLHRTPAKPRHSTKPSQIRRSGYSKEYLLKVFEQASSFLTLIERQNSRLRKKKVKLLHVEQEFRRVTRENKFIKAKIAGKRTTRLDQVLLDMARSLYSSMNN